MLENDHRGFGVDWIERRANAQRFGFLAARTGHETLFDRVRTGYDLTLLYHGSRLSAAMGWGIMPTDEESRAMTMTRRRLGVAP
jgi:hypothetical protein